MGPTEPAILDSQNIEPSAPRWSVPAPFTLLLRCRPTPLQCPPPLLPSFLELLRRASLPRVRRAPVSRAAVRSLAWSKASTSLVCGNGLPLLLPFSLPQFLLSQLKSGLPRASWPPHCTSDAAAHKLAATETWRSAADARCKAVDSSRPARSALGF